MGGWDSYMPGSMGADDDNDNDNGEGLPSTAPAQDVSIQPAPTYEENIGPGVDY